MGDVDGASSRERTRDVGDLFDAVSGRTSEVAGSAWSFSLAFLVIVVWALTGPVFGFSDTWQLVINTGTTIVTFLMVFLIQHSQNKDTRALQLKMDELIAATRGASNTLIDIEHTTDRRLRELATQYRRLADEDPTDDGRPAGRDERRPGPTL